MSDPFVARYLVPVAGGRLTVARAGPPVAEAEHFVLALHGITGPERVAAAVLAAVRQSVPS